MLRGTFCVLLGLLAACAGEDHRFDRPLISEGLREREHPGLGPAEGGSPPGVELDDGLTEEEAVAHALWNNAALQEALAELGLRRADIVVAGEIPNPVLSVLFPLSPKQLEFTLKLPLDFLWLRPARVAAAKFDAERVAALLVQGALDLVRDVRRSYAELALAEARLRGAERAAALGADLLRFTETRLRAGDASEADVARARAEAVLAEVERDRANRDTALMRPKLETLLGLPSAPRREFLTGAPPVVVAGAERDLLELALRSRPDLQAARLAIEGAAERADLAGLEFLALTAVLDANQPKGSDPLEVGPGIDVQIPIFNWNQGGRARASAELEKAARHFVAMRARIEMELRTSLLFYARAREAEEALRTRALPALDATVAAARRAFEEGETSRGPLLLQELRAAQVEVTRAEAEAEVRRAYAELERSIGRSLR